MSKTTDALDWAFEQGFRSAIAQLPVQDPAEGTSYSIPEPAEPVGFEEPEAASDPMDDPELQDVSPIPGYDAEAVAQKQGWNEALDFARDEILENFDTLVGIAQRAADTEDLDIQTEVMSAIDRRVSELKR